MAFLYVLLGALVVGAVAFGVAVLITGADPGLTSADSGASDVPLPTNRPLSERDFTALRFDTGLRGYRMAEVDTALRRAAYDVGYKEELIAVLEAEVSALRAGRLDEADALQRARRAALGGDRSSDDREPEAPPAHAPQEAQGGQSQGGQSHEPQAWPVDAGHNADERRGGAVVADASNAGDGRRAPISGSAGAPGAGGAGAPGAGGAGAPGGDGRLSGPSSVGVSLGKTP